MRIQENKATRSAKPINDFVGEGFCEVIVNKGVIYGFSLTTV